MPSKTNNLQSHQCQLSVLLIQILRQWCTSQKASLTTIKSAMLIVSVWSKKWYENVLAPQPCHSTLTHCTLPSCIYYTSDSAYLLYHLLEINLEHWKNLTTATGPSACQSYFCSENNLYFNFLGRVALVRGGAGYSHQTFPWTICLSVHRSSALWKNGGSDPDAVWHHRSDGSRDEAGNGVWNRSTEMGTFWGKFGAHHCNQRGFCGVRVRQCGDAALHPN